MKVRDQAPLPNQLLFFIEENQTIGNYLLRVKTNWNEAVPDNACMATQFGETEDYIVFVSAPVGITTENVEQPFEVFYLPNNHFAISTYGLEENTVVYLTVTDMLGKTLIYQSLKKSGGSYDIEIDMSYIDKGMYIITLLTSENAYSQQIFVQ